MKIDKKTEEQLQRAEDLGVACYFLLSCAPSMGTAQAAWGLALGLMASEWFDDETKRKQFIDDACQSAHVFLKARALDPDFWPSGTRGAGTIKKKPRK